MLRVWEGQIEGGGSGGNIIRKEEREIGATSKSRIVGLLKQRTYKITETSF